MAASAVADESRGDGAKARRRRDQKWEIFMRRTVV